MRRVAAAALIAISAHACSDSSGPAAVSQEQSTEIFVSDPSATAGSVNATASSVRANIAAATAFISVPPGRFPTGFLAEIVNKTQGSAAVFVPLVEGGFDPTAVPANPGDEVQVKLMLIGGQSVIVSVKVPIRRPPAIVRSNPARGRSDVALNVVIEVVFSEPVSKTTVTPSTVALLRDGVPVSTAVGVSEDGLRAIVTPNSPLSLSTSYTIIVNGGILDSDGDALQDVLTAEFTTQGPVFQPAPNGVSGDLLFVRLDDRNIYSINIDGTKQQRLTATGGISSPKWSPDGERIAFTKNVRGQENRGFGISDVFVANADGSNVVSRTTNSFFNSVTWSPDGKMLAVSDEDVYYATTYLLRADDFASPPVLLAKDARTAAWSPDGERIAYVRTSGDDGYHQIVMIDSDGTNSRDVTPIDPGGIYGLSWSPGGDRLAFSKCLQASCEIYIIGADGSGLTQVTNLGDAQNAAWSPDGKWIAFTRSQYAYGQWSASIAIVSVNGGPATIVAPGGFSPSWRPVVEAP